MSEPEHLIAELRVLRSRVEFLEGLVEKLLKAVEGHHRDFTENAPSWVVSSPFDHRLWLIFHDVEKAYEEGAKAAGAAAGYQAGMREVERMRNWKGASDGR